MKQRNVSRRQFLRIAGSGAAILLASCTPSAQPTPAPAAPAATSAAGAPEAPAPTNPPAKDRIALSWTTWVTAPVDNDNMVKQALDERFNVDLTFLGFERATWFDQINTRVAGGDIPDIIYRDSRDRVQQYVDQGVLGECGYADVKAAAPVTFDQAGKFTMDVWLASSYNGKNWGVPLMQPSQVHPFTDGWRQDWLDKVGITKVPETLEECEAAFTHFVQDDPDGDGNPGTYAFTTRGKDAMSLGCQAFFGAFGTFPSRWMQVSDTELQYGIATDAAKAALELLQAWYKKGFIDPEFVTTDWAQVKQKFFNSKIGYLDIGTWYRLVPGGEIYDGIKSVNPDAQLAMAPAPKGPDGKFGYPNWGPVTSAICFGKQTQGDKLAKALEVIEGTLADKELCTLVHWGKEGEHWERDSNGGAIWKAPYDQPEKRASVGVNFFAAMPGTPKCQAYVARQDEPQLYALAEAGNVKNFVPYADLFIPPDVAAKATEAAPTQTRWEIDFITGEKSLSDWDNFLQEWNDAGGKILTEAANSGMKTASDELQAIKDAVDSL